MCSCILRRRISLRTSLAIGWQQRVCCPLHHDWIFTAALLASVGLSSLMSTSPGLGACSIFALAESEFVSGWLWGVVALTSSVAEVVRTPENTFSMTLVCLSRVGEWWTLFLLDSLGFVGHLGAKESGSNVSVSSSLSELIIWGVRSDANGRNVDSEDSMLLLSFSSSVCTSSRKMCSSTCLWLQTVDSGAWGESLPTHVLICLTGSAQKKTWVTTDSPLETIIHIYTMSKRTTSLIPWAGELVFFTSLASSSSATCGGLWLLTSRCVGRGGLWQPPRLSSSSCRWCNLWWRQNDIQHRVRG